MNVRKFNYVRLFIGLVLLLIFTGCGNEKETNNESVEVSDSEPESRIINVATASDLNLLAIWDGHDDEVSSLAFSSDGTQLASTGWDRAVYLWDVATAEKQNLLEPADLGIARSASFAPDGSWVVAAGNAEFWWWDTQTRNEVWHSNGFGATTMSSAFYLAAEDGKGVFADAFGNLTFVRLGKATGGEVIAANVDENNETGGAIMALAFNSDGTQLVSGDQDGDLSLWDTETGSHLATLPDRTGYITAIALHDTLLAVVTGDPYESTSGTVTLWNLELRTVITSLQLESGSGTRLAFNSDGSLLAVGTNAGQISVWDTGTQQQLRAISESSAWITALTFSPDGLWLVSGSKDGKIRLWGIGESIAAATATPALVSVPDDGEESEQLTGDVTYSQVLQSYPDGVQLCITEAIIEAVGADGSWLLNGKIEFRESRMLTQCYGTKITAGVDVTIDGVTYPAGSLLTVDADEEWIVVTSWD